VALPLKESMNGFLLLKNFLDNINNIVIFILVVLGVLLVYSLMNSNVDTKTYEFGMMRTLGLPKNAIRLLLIL
jgi:ABC-type antimicrobial peptide transport system permease subunit